MPLNLILIYYFNFCHQEKNGKKIVLKKKKTSVVFHMILRTTTPFSQKTKLKIN